MFGEGSERLHAGHEVRQANVRRRPDHPREGAEHPHPSGGGDVHQGDRGQRFVSGTLIPQVVRFVSEHPHPTGGEVCIRASSSHRWWGLYQSILIPQVVRFVSEHPHPTCGEVCIRAPSSYRRCQKFVWVSQPPLAGHLYRFSPRALVVKIRLKKNGVL